MITLTAAGVGSLFSVLGLLIGHVLGIWKDRRCARRDSMRASVEQLYAPAAYLVTDVEMLFNRADKMRTAIDKHFAQPWHESAMERVSADFDASVAAANSYVMRAEERMDALQKLLDEKWHLVDRQDRETFDEIRMHRARMQIEFKSETGKSVPLPIRNALEPIPFCKFEWINKIKIRYDEKAKQLDRL